MREGAERTPPAGVPVAAVQRGTQRNVDTASSYITHHDSVDFVPQPTGPGRSETRGEPSTNRLSAGGQRRLKYPTCTQSH